MAADPKMIPFLLGIGIGMLSVEVRQIPRVYRAVCETKMCDARTRSDKLLRLGRIRDVESALQEK